MKKIYMQPKVKTVYTAQTLLQSVSKPFDSSDDNKITSDSGILTKESNDWDIWE